MDHFRYTTGRMWCEDVPLDTIADAVGTPAYVYSASTIRHHVAAIRNAFAALDPLVCYAVKANPNLAVLTLLKELGTGFDIVSLGELVRVGSIGASYDKVVFSGVGKTEEEMRQGLEAGILMFNVESEEELDVLAGVAAQVGRVGGVAIRVNPDVDPKTHRYITTGKKETKFGVDFERGAALARAAANSPHLELRGIQCHIGSQITSVDPFRLAIEKTAALAVALRAEVPTLEWLNMGGGYGIYYRDERVPLMDEYADAVTPILAETGLRLVMEPGRLIVGNAGVLLTRVLFNKRSGDRRFVIVDAGMNDLLRPSLYEGYHRIWPTSGEAPPTLGADADHPPVDVVGPVCESGDFLAKDRPLPPVARDDLLAVMSVGAYAFSMSSNYNARCRAAEVMVDGDRFRVVRVRESLDDLARYDRPDAEWVRAAPGAD